MRYSVELIASPHQVDDAEDSSRSDEEYLSGYSTSPGDDLSLSPPAGVEFSNTQHDGGGGSSGTINQIDAYAIPCHRCLKLTLGIVRY